MEDDEKEERVVKEAGKTMRANIDWPPPKKEKRKKWWKRPSVWLKKAWHNMFGKKGKPKKKVAGPTDPMSSVFGIAGQSGEKGEKPGQGEGASRNPGSGGTQTIHPHE
jgi:hypothetical protein